MHRPRAAAMKPACLIWVLSALPASAAPAVTSLSPATSRIEYTVYAFGMIPMSAHFDIFSGTIGTAAPPAPPCQVAVTVRIASLRMADPERTQFALGASMLDAAHFPTMGFTGQCAGATLAGELTLHGITHPLVLTLSRQKDQMIATGNLQRRDYAITGLPGLVGQRIRIRLQTALPPAIAALR